MFGANVFAQDISEKKRDVIAEEVLVIGGQDALDKLAGSASIISEVEITRFATTDVNDLLTKAPGIYIRQEDGFGLRPNINIRGTSSDRSSKITIMEDGMLIGPAPYSAPAAYYVPNVTRMQTVEVVKGPSAIQYGPHTVGGAINFVTRAIPTAQTGEANVLIGSDGLRKLRGFYGNGDEAFGYWVDALHYGSDGFKQLDGGGDTGFERNDINAKMRWQFGMQNDVAQTLTLKLGYADEAADETYLGLTDADFAATPNRRYAASALDKFVTERTQLQLLHTIETASELTISTRAYHHNFERSWNKVDAIVSGSALFDVFASSALNRSQVDLLRGDRDTSDLTAERIDITNNDRSFGVSGIESKVFKVIDSGQWQHNVTAGLRYHTDYVERDHSPLAYFMRNRELVLDEQTQLTKKALNKGETTAISAFFENKISIGDWRFDLGLRHEAIDMSFVERATGESVSIKHTQNVWLPGVGVFYQTTDNLGLFGGVNKGFSPKAPSAGEEVEHEESVNYELGLRYRAGDVNVELIGFYSDYENLLGRCRASDPCAGEESNGGRAEVTGLEFQAGWSWQPDSVAFSVPVTFTYTLTQGEFLNSFSSTFPQWGDVAAGDALPYLPEQQGRFDLGMHWENFALDFALKHVSEMREIAEQGVYEAGEFTEALTTADIAASYQVNARVGLRFVIENLTDTQEIVSRRPYGARPNLPRTVKLSAQYKF